ncbi:hypothetical protein J4460_08980 [Candidatus Woesearchaeota archaeon]|nr:hypothetical protein [Candidatus Woesearchaeota archaeon]HIH37370.1 hypothetical protein [Candidatus Woesearchaeota archaeon]HIH48615.1 hypothetical protein [Candidatus Woesearchaeota archaeon]HIJ03605.1 hypothetical protein [Candidatus Woesearchaeota archaeon]
MKKIMYLFMLLAVLVACGKAKTMPQEAIDETAVEGSTITEPVAEDLVVNEQVIEEPVVDNGAGALAPDAMPAPDSEPGMETPSAEGEGSMIVATDGSVSLGRRAFVPSEVSMAVGDEITVKNTDTIPHSLAMKGDPEFRERLASEGMWSTSFDTVGVYEIYDTGSKAPLKIIVK